jgi:hypothetical protein
MPSGRIRFAELASSMLWSAPVLALLAVLSIALLGIDPSQHPQQAAYLFGMALVGSWSALVPNKLLETRRFDGVTRRLIGLAAGLLLGIVGTMLGHNLQLGWVPQTAFFEKAQNLQPVYFGVLYGVTGGWLSLASRDRKQRFRILPVLWTALLATALMPFWPYDRPEGIAIATMIAATVQLVSPWNEAASLYARYVRASQKQNRKLRQV